MFYFHQFPLLFALSSIIAIMMATVIIYVGLASLIVSFLSFSAATWGGRLLDFSTDFLNNSISYMASWDGTVIHSIWLESYEVIILMISLIALTIFIYSRKSGFLFTSLVCLIFQLGIHNFCLYKSLSQQEVIVYDTTLPMIDIIIGRQVYSWSHPKLTENEKYYSATYARIAKKIKRIEHLDFENYSIIKSQK
jgi:competence protein ComEC